MNQAEDCPKSMVYGPCGGVHAGDRCEVDGITCPFIAHPSPLVRVPTGRSTPEPVGGEERRVLVDVRAPARWPGDIARLWRETADVLQGATALLGEHVDNPRREDDSGPIDEAAAITILTQRGVPTIATVTGRDRDLPQAATQMARLVDAGAVAVHCVTGDHPAALAIDRVVRFGAESIALVEQASSLGLSVTVAESPASPGHRVERVLAKERAGARRCVLNHGGDVDDLVAFVDACRERGSAMDFVAPVPMIGDRNSALALARFPGLRLPTGLLERLIAAPNPLATALDVVAEMTDQIVASGRFIGVNLSGSASSTGPQERLEATGAFITAARAATGC